MPTRLILRHLCFTGPDQTPAILTFERGLNVLYGASDTGKSFVLESIDFMLGGKKPLRDIKERIGYDQVFLGVETTDGSTFTLYRSTSGGGFYLFEGLHQSFPEDVEATLLAPQHTKGKDDSLSSFLLAKVGLEGKKVRKNTQGTNQQFTFRNLARFCVVAEGDIQDQRSPIESGQVITRTAEYSAFKLLLTGLDDSAVIPAQKNSALSQSQAGKIEILDEILSNLKDRFSGVFHVVGELDESLAKHEAMIAIESQNLQSSESEYQVLVSRRDSLRFKLQNGIERRGEIQDLQARFTLLDQHYQSDLSRLASIREAGSLMAALPEHTCSLCGAAPKDQHKKSDCDGNIEAVVSASDAEIAKIILLRKELNDTIVQLKQEADSFDHLIPNLRGELATLEEQIKPLRPVLIERRTYYANLVDGRAAIRNELALYDQLVELQTRRSKIQVLLEAEESTSQPTTDFPTSVLDEFAQQVEQVLKAWHLPGADRIQFNETDRDLIIDGSRRGSHGKGMRSITHAAFTIGLLEYCKNKNLPHPGFVVLDSPLLAYRQPEGDEDDLRGTDVQDRFYEYLVQWVDAQVLIIENVTPPEAVQKSPTAQIFTGNNKLGRYGFFPNF